MIRRGFSLLEVLLAIGIVMILSGAIYSFLFDLMNKRDRIVELTDRARVGIGVLETIERDLTTTLAGASRFGAGISGTSTTLTLLSRSVTLPIGQTSGAVLGDLQGVRFSWSGSQSSLEASRWDVLSGGERTTQVLSTQVEYVQFRYYDGRAWRGEFDSSRDGALPVAIEVAIWFGVRVPAVDLRGFEGSSFREGFGAIDDGAFGDDAASEPIEVPQREPDRVRVIVVPDGPSVGWGAQS